MALLGIAFRKSPVALLFLSIWITWIPYFIFCCVLFFNKENKKSHYIKNRAPYLITSSAFGQLLMMTILSWKVVVPPEKFSNFCDHWLLFLFIPLHFLPYPIRAVRFIFQYYLVKNPIPKFSTKSEYLEFKENIKWNQNKWHWIRVKYPQLVTEKAFLIYNWVIMGIIFIIGLVYNVFNEGNYPDKLGGNVTDLSFAVNTGLLVFVLILIGIALWKLRIIDDDLAIKTELIWISVIWIVFLGPYIGIGWWNYHNPSVPYYVSPIFGIIACIASFFVSFGMPIHLAMVKPKEGALFKLKILENIDDLLADPEASQIFEKFLEKRVVLENYHFIRDVEEYKQLHSLYEQRKIESDPIKLRVRLVNFYLGICSRFIVSDAPELLNLKDDVSNAILGGYKSDDPDTLPASNIFDEAVEEVKKLLKNDCLGEFNETPEAIEYRRKLAVQMLNAGMNLSDVVVTFEEEEEE